MTEQQRRATGAPVSPQTTTHRTNAVTSAHVDWSCVTLTASAIAAKLFRGFADPTRLAILLALTEGERRVTDLVTQLGTAQSTVSGHLACLKDCGLVIDRPQGRAVYYRVASPEVYELLVVAERLVARTGTAIDLCPNYRSNQATPTPAKEPA